MKVWPGITAVVASVIFAAQPVSAAAKVPTVDAEAYVVADADTGEILAAKDPNGHYLPASTIKTLTAVTLIPKTTRPQTIKPSEQAVDAVPTKVGLSASRTYRVDDLMQAMLMESANDAAFALTEAGGGLQQTLDAMNAEAARLGAKDTRAGSPNGLDRDYGLSVKTQYTTAHDLAVIFRQGLTLPDFREYISTRRADFAGRETLTASDKLLGNYSGMIGGKSGFTRAAGRTYVGAAERDGKTIIVAEMGTTDAFSTDARALLDWGFANAGKTKAVGTLNTAEPNPTATSTPTAAPVPTTSPASAWLAFPVAMGGAAVWLRRRRST